MERRVSTASAGSFGDADISVEIERQREDHFFYCIGRGGEGNIVRWSRLEKEVFDLIIKGDKLMEDWAVPSIVNDE